MNKEKDGGQAFPHGDPTNGGELGMSLRDWFAGQALSWLCSRGTKGYPLNIIADLAYELSDAMLEEREK